MKKPTKNDDDKQPEQPKPAFNPRGNTMFQAMLYGLIDGTKFGVRWAWRYLFGSDDK